MSTTPEDDLPSIFAVPCEWQFVPEELDDEQLLGFFEGRYDSMNEGNDELVAKEREQARMELVRRGRLSGP
jgi:hypothetical protein